MLIRSTSSWLSPKAHIYARIWRIASTEFGNSGSPQSLESVTYSVPSSWMAEHMTAGFSPSSGESSSNVKFM